MIDEVFVNSLSSAKEIGTDGLVAGAADYRLEDLIINRLRMIAQRKQHKAFLSSWASV